MVAFFYIIRTRADIAMREGQDTGCGSLRGVVRIFGYSSCHVALSWLTTAAVMGAVWYPWPEVVIVCGVLYGSPWRPFS
jgi:hypothetical protein